MNYTMPAGLLSTDGQGKYCISGQVNISEKVYLIQVSFSVFSGKMTSARMVCDVKSTRFYQNTTSDKDERGIKIPEKTVLNLYSKPAFSGISELKQDFLSQFFPVKSQEGLIS